MEAGRCGQAGCWVPVSIMGAGKAAERWSFCRAHVGTGVRTVSTVVRSVMGVQLTVRSSAQSVV